ncbi:LLM class flavin-dependent oxidoreductase [Nonomuraea longicatena]|uniref:LLM class flavin-dependent oxidoreductase n=1 Tax=Nonomuraea longicatena TaxID=83682 RepID=A0ABP4BUI8_9ACTN
MSLYGVSVPASQHRLAEALETAQIADSLGADLVTTGDHPYIPSELDTWTLLPLILARTERVKVAPNVAPLALRPPTTLAKASATLAAVSGGRFVLGLGAGSVDERVRGFGGAWTTVGEAIGALDEAIPLIRRLWTAGPVSHQGTHYRLSNATGGPVPETPIPIWVGAFKPRMLAITGRHADGWLPTNAYLELAQVPDMQRAVDAAAEAAGRDPSQVRRVFNVMGTISDSAPERDDHLVAGSAAHWVRVLRDYRERLRFDSFVFWPVQGDTREQTRLFFEKVRPHLEG